MLRRDFLLKGAAASAAMPFAALPTARAQGSAPLQQVNIIGTSGLTSLVMSALLSRTGFLTELGVSANFTNVADGSKVVAALITGDADICPGAGFSQVLAAIERGASLKIVGGAADKSFLSVFSANPAVRTLKDLEGRTVAVGALGTQLHQIMTGLFRKYGVDSRKVRFANVGASVDVLRAVKARVVDAGPSEAWHLGSPGLHVVEKGETFNSLPEYISQAAFASNRAIAQKRDVIVKTLAAYLKLYRYIVSGDSDAAFMAASTTALGKTDSELARGQLKFYREIRPLTTDLLLNEARLKYMQDLNIITGAQKAMLSYDKIADMSLAREALSRLR